ncbi:hypothetical protein FRC10_008785 [Ceratobasidium sp. 414]|nr:hypothetical protein FRC10_008785 [Ceratobasidium sp. 414]
MFQVKDESILPVALRYCRTYSTLLSGDTYGFARDSWQCHIPHANKIWTNEGDNLRMMNIYTDLLEQVTCTPNNLNMLATATAGAMPFCHWNLPDGSISTRIRTAPRLATYILDKHLKTGGVPLSKPALRALVESTPHYLVALWPREPPSSSYSMLPTFLAQIFLASHNAASETARAAAIALAAAAFATDAYPGGEYPSHDFKYREERALDVLRFHETNDTTEDMATSLFVFGFIGLLPRLDLRSMDMQATAMSGLFATVIRYMLPLNSRNSQTAIHTLPPSFSLVEHATLAVCRCLLSVTDSLSPHNESTIAISCSLFLLPQLNLERQDIRLYVAALVALCHAESSELQDLCTDIINAQPFPTHPSRLMDLFDDKNLLEQLCHSMISSKAPLISTVTFHFKLLVAGIASSPRHTLGTHQSTLWRLLHSHPKFDEFKPSASDFSLPSIDDFLLYIQNNRKECAGDSLLHTMQFVANFCHARPTLGRISSGAESWGDQDSLRWRAILQELKSGNSQG